MQDQVQSQVNTAQDYTERLLNNAIDGLPAFVGALVILIISYFVAKALDKAVRRVLRAARLNERLHTGAGGDMIQRALPNPARLAGRIVFWVVFLFGVSLAIGALGIPLLNDFLRAIYGYLPNVIAALLIFMVAGAISTGIAALVNDLMGGTATGKVVVTASPIVVMSIATFMILNQLKIAPEIVTITYAALLGSASLGLALAFGLGGREVAGNILQDWYRKGQENRARVESDMRAGASNLRRKARPS